MYKVIYMKADYEPWWQFEGWEEHVVTEVTYDNEQEASQYLQQLIEEFSKKYMNMMHKKDRFWAFWSDDEREYCENCADCLPVYHGVIWEVVEGNVKK
ncbi:DUF1033 family protein [Kurthia sp. FSL E2-0154]|uniref:DUF1033 family protein n=1 Tax=Kurthia sp. FSL E2-0154 TaxID=2921358 RepID=UPI0030F8B426